eukprot:TRINITY_DN3796_c0_g1_i1.p1 TRINITY_DN3796_c0_g1~~TRINITY_DN3796_c0_g1_i1.p1  ORF type:complete len:353 (-),score=49.90 TRINITY_DN3796_c0_g1_i1:94-1152(-)
MGTQRTERPDDAQHKPIDTAACAPPPCCDAYAAAYPSWVVGLEDAVRVEFSPEAGRYYVASRDVKAGELLLTSEPDAAVVHEDALTRVCASCFRTSKKGRLSTACSSCKYVYYCSETCVEEHKASHDCECTALARLAATRPRLDREDMTHLRLVIQTVYRRRLLERETGGKGMHATKALYTGVDEVVEKRDAKLSQRRLASLCSAFACACGYDFHWTPQELYEILGAIRRNGFGIWREGQSSTMLGLSLTVPASLFNHSCNPNVAHVRQGTTRKFYALQDVEKDASLCISYIDPRLPRERRRSDLQSMFTFLCKCPRCESNGDLTAPLCRKHLGYVVGSLSGSFCTVCCADV